VKAFVSDIHGNMPALQTALAKIADLGIEKKDIYCLGDVIGYGPQPAECLKEARQWAWCIRGNHEDALLTNGVRFNPRARQAIVWSIEQLSFDEKMWITDWPETKTEPETEHLFVHGSPRNATEEYILPQRSIQKEFMRPLFGMFKNFCFVGHTHVPGVFRPDFTFQHPDEIGQELDLSKEEGKAIINVGSVGQPRDENPKGCFAVLDDMKLTWHRFDYDLETVIKKIYQIPELDNQLGDRLRLGR
jgi:predicted phosphodiesterase